MLLRNAKQTVKINHEQGTPVKILVSMVPGTQKSKTSSSPTPDASLTNTYWKLMEINGEPAALGAGEKELHMVLVGEDNRVRGFSGCNGFTGGYTINQGKMNFSQMASTMMACVDGMEQEQSFLLALQSTDRFEIRGDELSLFGSDGEILLLFEAVHLK